MAKFLFDLGENVGRAPPHETLTAFGQRHRLAEIGQHLPPEHRKR